MEKDKYFTLVKEIVNKIDPIGLLKQGAPSDEYEEEIQRIAAKFRICNSTEDIQKLVYNIFKENFGQETAGDISLYLDIAQQLSHLLKSRKRGQSDFY